MTQSFFDEFAEATAKAGATADRLLLQARNKITGILNPNERSTDKIREEIDNSHRFNSFADQRSQNFVKWHVDGHDYMYAVSEMLDSAKHAIFILDWWLTPELYLRRPPAYHPEWRLDRLLKRKAEQGVKIYVVVYKEIPETMSMSSEHTQSALEALHPNIACMRHPNHIPDHITDKDITEFWSHHEVVVVDNHRACIGGFDLCFGRFDTQNHPLADVHPTDFSRTLFPGQDYNNARVLDFQNVANYVSNAVPIQEIARMPWHDVHMTLEGTVVLDIIQHFVERWNYIKRSKVFSLWLNRMLITNEHKCTVCDTAVSINRDPTISFYSPDSIHSRYEPLALPHNISVALNGAIARHPRHEARGDTGRQFSQASRGTCHVQAVRSVSEWSHGVPTECSIQNAYRALIRDAEHFIYIENQYL
ncbi:hypothetical protein PILCRDRAFT_830441 [Piloderma croceum F 1598]|uniref:phospholipase D n=1 Tax=Piloderma croceum (strain F 1598) TaxID=765440 RepID=A0A0C3EU03_PILCF|nr:hypothetical protein PILCRDRAFT_830441 [Piloderma croceum F 1598]